MKEFYAFLVYAQEAKRTFSKNNRIPHQYLNRLNLVGLHFQLMSSLYDFEMYKIKFKI